jgi:hypothetical protein
MYKQIISPEGTVSTSIIRLEDNACIPCDPANTDYQEFLRWCSEGNEPLPPDEGEA